MASSKEYVFKFKLDGVEQTSSSIDSLNSKVGNLDSNFQKVNKDIVDLKGNVLIGGKEANEQFITLDNNTKNLGNNFEQVNEKSKSFGHNLEKSTKSAGQGINALANGLNLVGVQNDNIQRVAAALQVLAGLMKTQETLSKAAFSSKGAVEQTKAIGQLATTQKANITLTQGAATANQELAVAEGEASVAAKGLGASLKALTASLGIFGLIALAIGAIVVGYSLWKDAQTDTILKEQENLQKDIELLKEVGKLTLDQIEHESRLTEIRDQNKVNVAEKQLEIMKLQNVSLDSQYAQEQNIVKLKQGVLQDQINEQLRKGAELNQQIEEQNRKYLEQRDITDSLIDNEEEYKKSKAIENGLQKDLNALESTTKGVLEKKTELQDQFNLSKATEGKITQLNYQKELDALALKKEQLLIELKQREIDTKDLLAKITFQTNADEVQKELTIIQDKIKDLESDKIKIDFEVKDSKINLLTDQLLKESEIELLKFKQAEEDKRKEIAKTFNAKIEADIKALKEVDESTNSEKEKDIQRSKILKDIEFQRASSEEAITLNLQSNLDKRLELTEKFFRKTKSLQIESPGFTATSNKSSSTTSSSSSITQESSDTSTTSISEQIKNVELLIEVEKKQLTEEKTTTSERIQINEEIIEQQKQLFNLTVKNETELLNITVESFNVQKKNAEDKIIQDQKALATENLTSKQRKQINEDIITQQQKVLSATQSVDKAIEVFGENTNNAQVQLFNSTKERIQEINKEITKELEGKHLTHSQLVNLDVDFKDFDKQLSDGLNKSKTDIENVSHDLFDPIKIEQDKLNKIIENGSGVRLGFIIRENKAMALEYKLGQEKITKIIEDERQKQLDALNKRQVSPTPTTPKLNADEFAAEVKKINTLYDGMIDNLEEGAKEYEAEWIKVFLKVYNRWHQYTAQLVSTVMDGLQAINDAEDAKTERQINRLQSEFDAREEFLQAEIDAAKEAEDAKANIVQDSVSKINQIEGQLQNARGQRQRYLLNLLDEEKMRRDKAAKEEEKAKEKAKLAQDEIDAEKKKKDEEIKELQKQATIRGLKLQRTQALVSGAVGAVQAFAGALQLGPVAGPIVGAIEAAAILAVTALQVDAINEQIDTAQQAKEGGQLVYSITDDKGKIIHKSGGGEVQGESHENGGVTGTGKFNNIEVEGGEFIINKKATIKNIDIIKKLNEEGSEKKFALVPAVQEQMKMAQGGLLPNFAEIERAVAATNQTVQPVMQDLTPIVNAIRELNIVVGVKQFADEAESLVKIKQFATV